MIDKISELEAENVGLEQYIEILQYGELFLYTAVFFIPIGWMAIRLFTPIRIVTQRLTRLLVGVLILFGMSELSKLNLRPFLELLQQSQNYGSDKN
jgi:hypothetical protein